MSTFTDGPGLVAMQCAHPRDPARDVPAILDRAARTVRDGGLVVLPEYFYKRVDEQPSPGVLEAHATVEAQIERASQRCQGIIVATVPEWRGGTVYNTAVVAHRGKIVHRQPKLRPTPAEREAGVSAHDAVTVTELDGVRVGVLVCADVLALDVLAEMAALRPEVVAVPVLSPNRQHDPTRASRTSVFVARAWDLGAYVVKAGGYAHPDVVGRSLITSPWGVLAQAGSEFDDALLSAAFEPERLAAIRRPFDALRRT